MGKQQVIFQDLGMTDYQAAWDYQEELLLQNVKIKALKWEIPAGSQDKEELSGKKDGELIISGQKGAIEEIIPETRHHLLFVEHPPVYTLGKSGHIENVLINEEERENKHIRFFKINRGGDITFHGPGQLVAYPILDLEKFYRDIGKYMRNLEEVTIRTLADYGIKGERSTGETGVWIDPGIMGKERKICAIGIRCSRWITMHGFALNVNTDLDYFKYIIPCGIQNKQVTSLSRELSREVPMDEIKQKIKKYFEEVFDAEIV